MTKDELREKLDKAEKKNKELSQGIKDRIVQVENYREEIKHLHSIRDDLAERIDSFSDRVNDLVGTQKIEGEQSFKDGIRIRELEGERNELLTKAEELKEIIEAFVCLAKTLN